MKFTTFAINTKAIPNPRDVTEEEIRARWGELVMLLVGHPGKAQYFLDQVSLLDPPVLVVYTRSRPRSFWHLLINITPFNKLESSIYVSKEPGLFYKTLVHRKADSRTCYSLDGIPRGLQFLESPAQGRRAGLCRGQGHFLRQGEEPGRQAVVPNHTGEQPGEDSFPPET